MGYEGAGLMGAGCWTSMIPKSLIMQCIYFGASGLQSLIDVQVLEYPSHDVPLEDSQEVRAFL